MDIADDVAELDVVAEIGVVADEDAEASVTDVVAVASSEWTDTGELPEMGGVAASGVDAADASSAVGSPSEMNAQEVRPKPALHQQLLRPDAPQTIPHNHTTPGYLTGFVGSRRLRR